MIKKYLRKMFIRQLVKFNVEEYNSLAKDNAFNKVFELLAFIKFFSKTLYCELVADFRDDLLYALDYKYAVMF